MSKISPCLWFDGDAEEAASFYVSLLPDSRIEKIQHNIIDGHSGKAGSVLVIEFTLAGQGFMALNGGMERNTPTPSPSRSIAPIRPRSIGSGMRCWRTVAKPTNAAGCRIVSACTGRSCRRC